MFLIVSFILAITGCGGSGRSSSGQEQVPTQAIIVGEEYQITTSENAPQRRFSIPLEIGSTYSVNIINEEASSGNITVELLDTGISSETLAPARMFAFDYSPLTSSQLIIDVEGTSSSVYRYTLQVFPSTAGGLMHDSAFEPNNSRNVAYPVVSAAEYTSSLALNDDFDWYSLEMMENDYVLVSVSNDLSSTSFLEIQFHDDFGDPVSQRFVVTSTEELQETIMVQDSGNLFMSVSGVSAGTAHDYQFSMTIEGTSN